MQAGEITPYESYQFCSLCSCEKFDMDKSVLFFKYGHMVTPLNAEKYVFSVPP